MKTSELNYGLLLQLLKGAYRAQSRSKEIFINRNLKMESIEMVGFDMDYTLLMYKKKAVEEKAFHLTIEFLIQNFQYPESIKKAHYVREFAKRGLMVDKRRGNVFKINRHHYVVRGYHGRSELSRTERRQMYLVGRQYGDIPEFYWVDTLFELPIVCLYSEVVQVFDDNGINVDYEKIFDEIRTAIDTVHRNDSLKSAIRSEPDQFIDTDENLAKTLHKFRLAGKSLFLLTNSEPSYTDFIMKYLLDGALKGYPSWKNYFDYIICSSAKPAFFTQERPFYDVIENYQLGKPVTHLLPHKMYVGGNIKEFERFTNISGDNILYVGDHIYGDIITPKKGTLWRTALILQDLEDEIITTHESEGEIQKLNSLKNEKTSIDERLENEQLLLKTIEHLVQLQGENVSIAWLDELDNIVKAVKEKKRIIKRLNTQVTRLQDRIERNYNPFWGPMFREDGQKTRIAEQVEKFACLYTSNVSNFLYYSPNHYFRASPSLMPHER